MKVSKPKENQLLFEDDNLKQLKLEVESKTGLSKSVLNEIYEGLILGYRTVGMEASKQVFVGDKLSLMTLFSSMIENMLTYKILTEKELQQMINLVLEKIEKEKE